MEHLRVLVIGQLPKEAGGNYTTGAANVVYELSQKSADGVTIFTFGTNIPQEKAVQICSYQDQYIGYEKSLLRVVADWIFHPVKTVGQWHHYRCVDHENPLRLAFYKVNIERAIALVHPDVIHVNSIGNLSTTRFALNEKSIPVLLTCHGIFYRGNLSDRVGRDRYMGNIALADAYSGLTRESLQEYEQILNIPEEKVTIIPNGVDCSKFYYSLSKREEIRRSMNVPQGTLVMITVASVQERKGQFSFVKLLSKIRDFDYQYWIVGQGPDTELIDKYVTENNLTDRIKLLGYRPSNELFAYYSAADVYAHVSTKEGQALCEIEAGATGLRTIVNKKVVGTVPDLSLGDYYVLDMDCPNYSSLLTWLNQPAGTRESSQSLDWQVIFEQYVALYRSLLKR